MAGAATFVLALLAAGTPAPAPLAPDQRTRAIEQLDARIAGCPDPERCMTQVVQIALLSEPPGTPLQQVAEERLLANLQVAKDELFRLYRGAPPATQARILGLLDRGWENMHRGVDFTIVDLVARALASRSAEVRLAAGTLASRHPLRRIGNPMVDATAEDPALRPYALRAIEVAQDELVARWVVAQVGDGDPAIDALALRATAAIGRDGLTAVEEKLASPDPAERRRGIRALLAIATFDDGPALENWLRADGAADPELAAQVTRALAELEVGRYRFALPALPPPF
jgi:hypothetical protein